MSQIRPSAHSGLPAHERRSRGRGTRLSESWPRFSACTEREAAGCTKLELRGLTCLSSGGPAELSEAIQELPGLSGLLADRGGSWGVLSLAA
jgi:hypothetical protein